MSPTEESIIAKERKQIRATLEEIRLNNNAIGKELAGFIRIIGLIRTSQLGIELMITELENKLGKQ